MTKTFLYFFVVFFYMGWGLEVEVCAYCGCEVCQCGRKEYMRVRHYDGQPTE